MLRIACCVVGIVALVSCTSEEALDPDSPAPAFQDHVLMFNGAGQPIDPLGNAWPSLFPYRAMGDDEFRRHVSDVFDAAAREFQRDGVKDLFVFVHGGLNTQAGTVERTQVLLPLMLEDGYYPIFINWQSSLVSSYFEHLFFVRQGRDEGWSGVIWSPFVLLSDMARTIARAPLGLGRMAGSMWTSLPFAWTGDQAVARSTANAALAEYQEKSAAVNKKKSLEKALNEPSNQDNAPKPGESHAEIDADLVLQTFPIEVGNDQRGTGEQIWSMTKWVVTFPIKVVTGLVVQGFGTPAWEMMQRRTHLLFAEEDRYLEGGIGARNDRQSETLPTFDGEVNYGGLQDAARLSRLFDEAVVRRDKWVSDVKKEVQESEVESDPTATRPGDDPVAEAKSRKRRAKIIACGHSMGAIVLNELVRRDTRRLVRAAKLSEAIEPTTTPTASPVVTPLFDDLVYLAPACSVADFVDTVIPYLELAKTTRVYVLVLHPRAEVNESNMFELAPRGSLLDWIDTFLSNPVDSRERRLGEFTNLMLSLHEFPLSVRGRIQVRAFGYAGPERAREPEKHGQFTDLSTARWWRRSFWEVWPRRIESPADVQTIKRAPIEAKADAEQSSKD